MRPVLTSGFLLTFINLGPTELVILLVIILILFGGSRLPSLMHGMGDGIRNFKDGARQADEVWQFSDGRQRQLPEPQGPGRKWAVLVALGGGAFLLIVAGLEGAISAKQILLSLGVLVTWFAVWWFYFSKGSD